MPSDPQTTTARLRAGEELRLAALEEFAAVGFGATSLQHVADRAGYAKSSVLYHYGSKEALLEAAITPGVADFEALVDGYLARTDDARRFELVEQVVDLLLAHRLAVHVFLIQGQALHDLPIIARADAAVRRLAAAICDERESAADGRERLDDEIRFGMALGGAAFLLTAGRSYVDPDRVPDDAQLRSALLSAMADLLLPADRRPGTGRTTTH
ncbi:TetR/AcrR family transcriptional regulator [Agromyces sp. MMS24-K17]|uniref:TetR/AcrR family transcriptional regulator n=1 Tax=Agromyces sp. MMS24-K17 TaxID=3372850 RepID=UPI003754A3B3